MSATEMLPEESDFLHICLTAIFADVTENDRINDRHLL